MYLFICYCHKLNLFYNQEYIECPAAYTVCFMFIQIFLTKLTQWYLLHCHLQSQLLSVHHHGKCFISDTVNQLAHLPVTSVWLILETQQNSASKSSFLVSDTRGLDTRDCTVSSSFWQRQHDVFLSLTRAWALTQSQSGCKMWWIQRNSTTLLTFISIWCSSGFFYMFFKYHRGT